MSKKDDQKKLMFTAVLRKEGGKLVYCNKTLDDVAYKAFIDNMAEGQLCEAFFDANIDDATLSQLAKVHKCIRELAIQTGYSFEDMKLYVKKAAGLCVRKDIDGEMILVCKSFSNASKEDLMLAIQAIIEMADNHGINFR